MFNGTIPVEIEKLKQIYRDLDQLSLQLAAFATDARRDGLPKEVEQRIDGLEDRADAIKALFDELLTSEEQEELMGVKRGKWRKSPPWRQ